MKNINNLSVRLALSLIVGILFAGVSTHMTYSCTSADVPAGEPAASCVSFEKAVMHPADLVNNKHGSLVAFSENVVIVAIVCFAVCTVILRVKRT